MITRSNMSFRDCCLKQEGVTGQYSKGRTLMLTSTMTMTILLLRRSQVGRWTKAWKSVKVELSFHKNDFSSEAKIFLIFALTFHSLSLSLWHHLHNISLALRFHSNLRHFQKIISRTISLHLSNF